MSIKILSQIWETGPQSQGELLVLLALADFANDAGECWPSMDAIATKARLSDARSARRVIRRLEEGGWVESDIGGGRYGCTRYTVKPGPKVPRTESPPDNGCTKPGQSLPETRTVVSAEPSRTIIEPSECIIARDGFDEFWQRYPRKIGKGNARRAYAKAVKAANHDDIMFGLSQQMPGFMARQAQYIPHPATWLNAERWNDEPEQPNNGYANGHDARAHRPGAGMAAAFASVAQKLSRDPQAGGGGNRGTF